MVYEVNENEKQAFLMYADTIIAECHKIRFEEGIPGSARYSNMEEKLTDQRQFYVLGYSDGREKMAKEILTIMKALQTAEQKYSEGIVNQLLNKIAGDKKWQVKRK